MYKGQVRVAHVCKQFTWCVTSVLKLQTEVMSSCSFQSVFTFPIELQDYITISLLFQEKKSYCLSFIRDSMQIHHTFYIVSVTHFLLLYLYDVHFVILVLLNTSKHLAASVLTWWVQCFVSFQQQQKSALSYTNIIRQC